ncbi:MAG: hypothetical protein A2140_09855 [Candidatus Muproteobacteria bacterium RBG_16_62_13]|uniref:Diguanylate cyclase n=1 Tax=Candidatus Muproteobacteria bacterium RBG_16_62_13 TaxID=1817756 RepID=A0A1F6SY86_9PROT|nr:MAG: hypothetical protein A2140_09855 [Candidatus Muproteobacteria bacterium RBG_16_62_13]
MIVDQSPDDTELAVTAIRKCGYMLKTQRVQDLAGMQAAIDKGQWDVVISEFSLPHFSAQMAHDLLKKAGREPPFIILTRAIPDNDLLAAMRSYAQDVVMKDQAIKLAPVIERELRAAEDRRRLNEATARVTETEQKSKAVIDGSREALCYLQDGMHLDANKTYLDLFGYESQDALAGIPVMNLIDKADQKRFKDFLRKPPTDNAAAVGFNAVRQDGSRFPVELTLSPITLNGEPCLQLMVSDVGKRKAVETKLQYMNQHDPLTGLYNRHYFLQTLNKVVEQTKQGKGMATVLYMDMQQLKHINQSVNYAAGDRMLIKVARLMRDHLGEDTALARFGGDEFAALLHKGESESRRIAEHMLDALRKTAFTEAGKSFHCDCHLSVTAVERDVESAQAVLACAYQAALAMHAPASPMPAAVPPPVAEKPPASAPAVRPAAPAAKVAEVKAGGDPWLTRLQQAVERESFTLIYQPMISMSGEGDEYYEVLVRLVDENGELVPAGKFMPAAEKTGLCAVIDRWVIRNAVEALGSLHHDRRPATFFINLSTTAFKDADLLPSVIRWLREASVKPAHVVFEANESQFLTQPQAAAIFIRAAGKLGTGFSIDNYGHHLTDDGHLNNLPIGFAKIDASFLKKLSADPSSRDVLKAVVTAAQARSLKTIAKCVESAESLAGLWSFGFDYVQGEYFESAEAQAEADQHTTLSSEIVSAPNWATSTRG